MTNLFIKENGAQIPVEIVKRSIDGMTAQIRALEGYPFVLSHGFGVSIKHPSDRNLRCYALTWVNMSDIREA